MYQAALGDEMQLIDKLYERYKECDINLAIYLQTHSKNLDDYDCLEFRDWIIKKELEFEKDHTYEIEEIPNTFIRFLLDG